MVQRTVSSKTAPRKGRPTELRRAEQQRSQETRGIILNAALSEFAAKGFEAASIRNIADRVGLQHPLITYHYRSKDVLWQAVAEYVFERIRSEWDAYLAETPALSAVDHVKGMYKALFKFTVDYPEFHRFMLQEFLCYSPRLQWLADTVLKPLINWVLPQIHAAQEEGALPQCEPIIFHYLLISLTSTLSGFGPEMQATANISPSDPNVVETYWQTVEEIIFQKQKRPSRSAKAEPRSNQIEKPPRMAGRSKTAA
ncbi:TetR/AcrR family transcriptional regulator [Paraburkholderia flagellata]|uniref:TetR/AcrR family transcriptional regulator n=1 Tax=Paraburkholderia flagellata TaxID=2883241 RepID=UPI001F40044E|nr:TetR/AcrR family transcriptional regulator [Paraburkholderia flagellata]